jgi:hypothetical protein
MHYGRQAANSHHRLSFIFVFEVVFSTLYADVKELFLSRGQEQPERADVYGSEGIRSKIVSFAK